MKFMINLGYPMIVLGGGGYTVENVAKCWYIVNLNFHSIKLKNLFKRCYETSIINNIEVDNLIPKV
jgi:hypothetical protein